MNIKDQIRQAIVEAGLPAPPEIIIDGEIHRFSTNGKPSDRAGYYCFWKHENGFVAGFFGDWRTGIQERWHSKRNIKLNPKEKQKIDRWFEEKRRQIEEQRQQMAEKAKEKACKLWELASSEIDHPYIKNKHIITAGVKQRDNALLIPVTIDGHEMVGLQLIYPNGEKRFISGTPVKGNYFSVGSGEPIYICEGYATGMSIYEAIEGRGMVIVAFNANNLTPVAKKIRSKYPDAKIIVCADNDQWTDGNPGLTKARETAKTIGAFLAVPEFKDLSTKPTDFNDLHVLEGLKAVKRCLSKARPVGGLQPEVNKPAKVDEPEKKSQKKPSQAETLAKIAEQVEFFHTPDRDAYARIRIDNHYEIYPVRSKDFKHWLSYQFYLQEGKPPNSQALADALNSLEGKALFEGEEAPVFIRLAEYNGNIYLDLANDKWQVVEITPDGWEIISNPPVRFRRPKGLLPLPEPAKNGDITLLRQFLNLEREEDWILTVAWLVYALKPGKGYPVLALYGEQGSAKSTFSEILRNVIDPSTAPLRTAPRTERDLIISATNSWILAFDNLSGVVDWLSDAFCRLSTGGGMATRQLYTDSEEMLFEASRPLIINGITDIVTRHDLADRCISITLPPIPEEKRITKQELFQELKQVLPSILGGLLNAVSVALKNINSIQLDRLPRMADFALWVVSAEEALPWEKGQFLEAYSNNRKDIVMTAINEDILANAIVEWFEDKDHWEGTATDLLDELESFIDDEKTIKSKYWPQNERSLGRKIRRTASFLRELGIDINFTRTKTGRKILLDKNGKSLSLLSPLSPSKKINNLQGDDKGDKNDKDEKNVTNMSSRKLLNLLNGDKNDKSDKKNTLLSKDKDDHLDDFIEEDVIRQNGKIII